MMQYNKLRQLKETYHLSDDELGRIIDLTGAGYAKMVKNQSMSVDYLEKLVLHFNIPYEWFFKSSEFDSEDPASPYYTKCQNPDCNLEKEKMKITIEDLESERKKLIDIMHSMSRKGGNCQGEPEGGVEEERIII